MYFWAFLAEVTELISYHEHYRYFKPLNEMTHISLLYSPHVPSLIDSENRAIAVAVLHKKYKRKGVTRDLSTVLLYVPFR